MTFARRFIAVALMVATFIGVPAAATALPAPTQTEPVAAVAASVPLIGAPQSGRLPIPDDAPGWDGWSPYLLSERWRDASQNFHGRYDQFLQNDVIAWSHRKITQQMNMSMGNTAYTLSQGLLIFGLEMEPLDLLGEEADKVAATIGVALYENSPVLIAVIVVILVMVAFQLIRSGSRPWKRIAAAAGIVALFVIMTVGAQASTTENGKYKPGFASPGWFAVSIADSISTIAMVPAQALTIDNPVMATVTPAGSGCRPYMDELDRRYNSGGPAVPGLVSKMWEASGLAVWKQVQYGTTTYGREDMTYGDHVFCHQLEWQAGTPATLQASVMFGSQARAEAAGYNMNSPAWGADDNNQRDRSLVAWAACDVAQNGTITVRQGFQRQSNNSDWITVADCRNWWQADSPDADLSAFNVGGKVSDVTSKTNNPAVQDFLLTLHGNDTGPGLVLTWGYGVSSFLMLLVFGSLGLAIALAKFAGVVMIITVFFVMLISLMARQDMGSKLAGFLKMYLGFTVFAFAATLILAMLTVLARMISGMGASVFGAGAFMSLILTGLAPVLAAILLHLLFTKVFKTPGIFRPSSAMAWGTAMGAVGGVVGAQAAQRAEGTALSRARNITRGAYRKTMDWSRGADGAGRGAGGRSGRMAPGGAGTAPSGPGRVGTRARGGLGAGMAPAGSPAAGAGGVTAGAGAGAARTATARAGGAAAKAGGARAAAGAGVAGAAAGAIAASYAARRRRAAAAAKASPAAEAAEVAQPQAVTPQTRTQRAIAATRETMKNVRSKEGRAQLRANGAEAIERARGQLREANRRRAAMTEWVRQDPVGAGGFIAEQAGQKTAAASRAAARAAKTVATRHAPAIRQGGVDAMRVGSGALIGAVAGGIPGAVIGTAIGAGRDRAAHVRAARRQAMPPQPPASSTTQEGGQSPAGKD